MTGAIEPADKSRRLSQGILERVWAVKSQDTSLELPIWAKADSVLQRIISAKSPSPAMSVISSSYRSQSPSVTPVNAGEDTDMSDLTATEAPNIRAELKADVQSRCQTIMDLLTRSMTPEERTSPEPRSSTCKQSNLSVNDAGRLKTSGKGRYQKKKPSGIARIQKIAPKPARGTRSHRLTKFYELDTNGVAAALLLG